MLRLNIIRPNHSSWGAPCILVRKPLEKGKPLPPSFVVDYRGLNAVTQGDGYPIPNVSNVLDAISGGKIFAKLDLASGHWQVPVNPKHREKTAFATHLSLFSTRRLFWRKRNFSSSRMRSLIPTGATFSLALFLSTKK